MRWLSPAEPGTSEGEVQGQASSPVVHHMSFPNEPQAAEQMTVDTKIR